MKDEAEKQDLGCQSGAFVEFGESRDGLLASESCCRNVETPWLPLSKPLEGGAEYPSGRWAEQGKMGPAEVRTPREEWSTRSLLDTASVVTAAGGGAHPASLAMEDGCLRADLPR